MCELQEASVRAVEQGGQGNRPWIAAIGKGVWVETLSFVLSLVDMAKQGPILVLWGNSKE